MTASYSRMLCAGARSERIGPPPDLIPGGEDDAVDGACLQLQNDAEPAAVDAYEVKDCVRKEVVLASGRRAWVYVSGASVSSASG